MKYREAKNRNILEIYREYYRDINGGIDGYYEKTILEGKIYEVYDAKVLAYFSVEKDRGLTSLYVLKEFNDIYSYIFAFVIKLPIFNKVLFTSNDKRFLSSIEDFNIEYTIQAYNFSVKRPITSSINMKPVKSENIALVKTYFLDFIQYNNIDLSVIKSFYCSEGKEVVSFGAIEPLRLDSNRYCISMIVNERYRNKGIGSETVKYLVSYLQSQNKEINARCYVKNEASLKTLLRSGLDISNYLFKVEKLKLS